MEVFVSCAPLGSVHLVTHCNEQPCLHMTNVPIVLFQSNSRVLKSFSQLWPRFRAHIFPSQFCTALQATATESWSCFSPTEPGAHAHIKRPFTFQYISRLNWFHFQEENLVPNGFLLNSKAVWKYILTCSIKHYCSCTQRNGQMRASSQSRAFTSPQIAAWAFGGLSQHPVELMRE